jgi:O-antigen ligase
VAPRYSTVETVRGLGDDRLAEVRALAHDLAGPGVHRHGCGSRTHFWDQKEEMQAQVSRGSFSTAYLILFLAIILSPLLLGSNRHLFWALNGALVSIALISMVLRPFRDSGPFECVTPALLLTAAGILLLLGWMWVQAGGFTPSGWDHPIWRIGSPVGSLGSISIDPPLTYLTIGWTAALSIMLVAIAGGSDELLVRRCMQAMAGTAAAVAVFGSLVEFLGVQTLGVAPKRFYIGWVTGTFVNRNSAATFFGLGAVAALSLLSARLHNLAGPGRRTFGALCDVDLRGWIWSFVAVVLICATILTGSRAGIAATLAGLLVFFAIWVGKRRIYRLGFPAIMGGAIVCILAGSAWLQIGAFDRLNETGARLSLYREALRAIGDRPIFGHGAGTYAAVQPLYHSSTSPGNLVWNRLHSTYLEAALTLGLPAVAIFLAVSVAALVWLSRSIVSGARPGLATAAALSGAAIVGTHSLVDFSLQVQAIALYFVIFVGLAVGETACGAQSGLPPESPASRTRFRFQRLGRGVCGVLVALLSGITFVSNARIAAVELATPSRLWLAELRPYAPHLPDVGPMTALGVEVGHSLGDPFAIYAQAEDCQRLDMIDPNLGFHTDGLLRPCLNDIDAALRTAPSTGALWLKRAALLADIEGASRAFFSAIANTYRTARYDPTLEPKRLALVLPVWRDVPPKLKLEIAREARHPSDYAVRAIASAYVGHPSQRSTISEALAELTDVEVRVAFARAVGEKGDQIRRNGDLAISARLVADCRENCVVRSKLSLLMVGEAFGGPPKFRLWIDGRPRHEEAVTAAKDTEAGEWLWWSDPHLQSQSQPFEFSVPAEFLALELEFVNDRWDQETGFDRNLGITAVRIDDHKVPISCFSVPIGHENNVLVEDGIIRFIRNGSVRLEGACVR